MLQRKVQNLMKQKEEYTELLNKLKESNQNEISMINSRTMWIGTRLFVQLGIRLFLAIRSSSSKEHSSLLDR
jgi:hypothetical protein